MEKPRQIGAGRHADAGPGFFDSACATEAWAAFEDQNTFAGAREIGGASQAVVPSADDDSVPTPGGEFADRHGKTNATEGFDGGGEHWYFKDNVEGIRGQCVQGDGQLCPPQRDYRRLRVLTVGTE
jgi:hypothetical protein